MILVLGDIIKDIYNYGKVRGVSAESPTLVMEREHQKVFYGGAALVHRHIQHLAKDENRSHLISISDSYLPIPMLSHAAFAGFSISTKERFFVDGYKLFQIDELNKGEHTKFTRENFAHDVWKMVNEFDRKWLILSDNRHGVFDKEFVNVLLNHYTRNYKTYVVLDSQMSQNISNFDWYLGNGVDCFVFNDKEFKAALDHFCLKHPESEKDYEQSLQSFSNRLNKWRLRWSQSKYTPDVIVKRGSLGSSAYVRNTYYRHTPTTPDKPIVDTCGAGDAFLAMCATTMLKNPKKDLQKANDYAAMTCTYIGTDIPDE